MYPANESLSGYFKRLGKGKADMDSFSRHGMVESERKGIQRQPMDGIALRAVFPVSGDGTSQIGQMDADLIFSPRLEFHFQQ